MWRRTKDKSPSSNVKRNSPQSESDRGRIPLHIWILGWLALAFLVLTFSSIRTLGQHQPSLHLAWACLCLWLVFVFFKSASLLQRKKIPRRKKSSRGKKSPKRKRGSRGKEKPQEKKGEGKNTFQSSAFFLFFNIRHPSKQQCKGANVKKLLTSMSNVEEIFWPPQKTSE